MGVHRGDALAVRRQGFVAGPYAARGAERGCRTARLSAGGRQGPERRGCGSVSRPPAGAVWRRAWPPREVRRGVPGESVRAFRDRGGVEGAVSHVPIATERFPGRGGYMRSAARLATVVTAFTFVAAPVSAHRQAAATATAPAGATS